MTALLGSPRLFVSLDTPKPNADTPGVIQEGLGKLGALAGTVKLNRGTYGPKDKASANITVYMSVLDHHPGTYLPAGGSLSTSRFTIVALVDAPLQLLPGMPQDDVVSIAPPSNVRVYVFEATHLVHDLRFTVTSGDASLTLYAAACEPQPATQGPTCTTQPSAAKHGWKHEAGGKGKGSLVASSTIDIKQTDASFVSEGRYYLSVTPAQGLYLAETNISYSVTVQISSHEPTHLQESVPVEMYAAQDQYEYFQFHADDTSDVTFVVTPLSGGADPELYTSCTLNATGDKASSTPGEKNYDQAAENLGAEIVTVKAQRRKGDIAGIGACGKTGGIVYASVLG